MPEFIRETGAWLYKQKFWAKMSSEEKVSWLEYRERIGMQYEDVLFLRELERCNMEQQDVVEVSRYNWDLDDEGVQDLREYQHAWQVLGGGPYIHARFLEANGMEDIVDGINGKIKKRRMITNIDSM